MKPSEILRKAADYHAEHGHCKGTYRDAEGRVCAMGAIYSATGCGWVEVDGDIFAIGNPLHSRETVAALDYAHLAAREVGHHVVHDYNDQPDTSPEDITLLLKRAAETAEAVGD